MNNKSTFRQKLKNKGSFYAILAVCLVIAGAGSYFTAKVATQTKLDENRTTNTRPVTSVTEPQITETEVNKNVTGVPDERYETEAPESEPEPENAVVRAAEFSLPLTTTLIKDYSNGELVKSNTMGDWRAHTGIDFAGNAGDAVKAVNNGIVLRVYNDALWGTIVEIDHGEGLTAKYCGLEKDSTVNIGDEVKAGDKVGSLGAIPIEEADGIHLHFEVTQDGNITDPLAAMGKTPDELS